LNIAPTLNRTEQLRKFGKLQCYYLDQFNQKESSYATSNGCKTVLRSEPRSAERGLSPSWSCVPGPGKCSGHLGDSEHKHNKVAYYLKIRPCHVIYALLHCCPVASAPVQRQEASRAAWIASSQYSCCSPAVNVSSLKLHSRRNQSSSDRPSISLRSWFLCDEMSVPVVRSWTRTNG